MNAFACGLCLTSALYAMLDHSPWLALFNLVASAANGFFWWEGKL